MIAEAVRTSRILAPRVRRRTSRLMPSKATGVPPPSATAGRRVVGRAVRDARRVGGGPPQALGARAMPDATSRADHLPAAGPGAL